MSELPSSWETVKLSELGSWRGGGTPSKANKAFWSDGTIPWVSPKDMKRAKLSTAQDLITEAAVDGSATSLVSEGSVLMVTRSGILSHSLPVAVNLVPVALNQDIKAITPSGATDASYLWNSFKCFERDILNTCRKGGTTVHSIEFPSLLEFAIPLPPLAEQKRIVAKIEELFSELDAGEESLRRARRQLGVYRQSLLKQAFEGKLTGPWRAQHPDLLESPDQLFARIQAARQARYQQQLKEWEKAVKDWEKGGEEANRPSKPREPESPTRLSPEEIDELVELPRGWCWMSLESLSSPEPRSIQSGPFGSSLKHEEFSNEGILVIGIDNVQKGYFSSGSQNRISPAKYRELAKYTARPKDFLITVMATVGRCCRIPDEIETAIITKHVYRVSPNLGLIDPDYLVNAALGCPAIILQIEKDKFGQTRPGLNGGFIKALPVPLCSLPEQQKIVRLLDEQFEVIEQNEREIDAALKRSETLRQSILKKAFTGQLVPQDPTDEPASALLERIRKKWECAAKPKKVISRK